LQRGQAREVLAAVPWFFHCQTETLERFVTQGRIREFRREESICRQGEEAHALGVILRGMVEVSSAAPSGKRHVLTFLAASEIFNLVPLLDHEPVVYDARAHEPSSILYVPEGTFLAALDQEPQLARDLMHLLSFRSRALSGYISDEMLMPLPTRCARMLLVMAELHGAPRADGSFLIDLKLSQEEFAEMLGRSRQSVNQELQKLEDAGLIETAYSRFVVRDAAALKAIADKY
jgi:CRP-like cAMP-binding protein